MKKKGFTLIELLVVIAIIAMLLAILMPALNKVKKIAQRVVCGTNLKGLGTAQVVYANDYEDAYVVQGGKGTHNWDTFTGGYQNLAKDWSLTGNITIGASLYLLVREADVSPKSFVCPSGAETAYDGSNTNTADNPDITELWDFGHINDGYGPLKSVSYSYQMPYGSPAPAGAGRFAADGTKSAAFATMSDKNPWFDSKILNVGAGTAADWTDNVFHMGAYFSGSVEKWMIQRANAEAHSREGQNVLFGDGHNSYEKVTDVGVRHDGIFEIRGDPTIELQIRRGAPGITYGIDNTLQPNGSEDSFLVNDDQRP